MFNPHALFKECYNLAEHVMLIQTDAIPKWTPEQTEKIDNIANAYYFYAEPLYELVKEMPNGASLLNMAIRYLASQINHELLDNYNWFVYWLTCLLTLCNPFNVIEEENIPFLLELHKGIKTSLERNLL